MAEFAWNQKAPQDIGDATYGEDGKRKTENPAANLDTEHEGDGPNDEIFGTYQARFLDVVGILVQKENRNRNCERA